MKKRMTQEQRNDIARCVEQDYPISQIQELVGLSYNQVYYYCKRYHPEYVISHKKGHTSPSFLKSRKNSMKIKDEDYEAIYRDYVELKLNVHVIAKKFNTTGVTICKTLRRFGITVRLRNGEETLKEPHYKKQDLEHLYWTQGKSLYEISKILGYSNHGSVKYDFKKLNIECRTYKEAGANLYKQRPELIELHRNNWLKRIANKTFIRRTTWIEQKFIDWAILNNIEYEKEFQIENFFHSYDFHIIGTKLLVEMDGTIWHASNIQKCKDRWFDAEADAQGYVVIRIPESSVSKQKNNYQIFDNTILPLLGGKNDSEY